MNGTTFAPAAGNVYPPVEKAWRVPGRYYVWALAFHRCFRGGEPDPVHPGVTTPALGSFWGDYRILLGLAFVAVSAVVPRAGPDVQTGSGPVCSDCCAAPSLATVSSTAESSMAARLWRLSGTTSRSPVEPSQLAASVRRLTRP